jgi:hypothetical protein
MCCVIEFVQTKGEALRHLRSEPRSRTSSHINTECMVEEVALPLIMGKNSFGKSNFFCGRQNESQERGSSWRAP